MLISLTRDMYSEITLLNLLPRLPGIKEFITNYGDCCYIVIVLPWKPRNTVFE